MGWGILPLVGLGGVDGGGCCAVERPREGEEGGPGGCVTMQSVVTRCPAHMGLRRLGAEQVLQGAVQLGVLERVACAEQLFRSHAGAGEE